MGAFKESVYHFKRKQFREYAKENYKWPGSEEDALFDGAIKGLEDKRNNDYVDKLKDKFGDDLLFQIFEWARVNLSPLEMEKFKNFEEMAGAYIEGNPGEVSTREFELLLGKDGKIKKFVPSPDDTPLGELEVDDDGNVTEKPPAPKIKVQPKIPDIAEARRMTSDELAKYLPTSETSINSDRRN